MNLKNINYNIHKLDDNSRSECMVHVYIVILSPMHCHHPNTPTRLPKLLPLSRGDQCAFHYKPFCWAQIQAPLYTSCIHVYVVYIYMYKLYKYMLPNNAFLNLPVCIVCTCGPRHVSDDRHRVPTAYHLSDARANISLFFSFPLKQCAYNIIYHFKTLMGFF